MLSFFLYYCRTIALIDDELSGAVTGDITPGNKCINITKNAYINIIINNHFTIDEPSVES